MTRLTAAVQEVVAPSGVAITYVDHAGAMSHLMHGIGPDDDVLDASRRLAIDPAAISGEVHELCVLGYRDTPQRFADVLARYREAVGSDARLSVALRPLLPDCQDADNLAAKLQIAAESGVEGIEFYHYAMMPLNRLEWIAGGLRAAGIAS